MTATYVVNPTVRAVSSTVPDRSPLAFHRRLPGYAPTPLVNLPNLAQILGLGQVWLKDESRRLGLPSFKMLGASYATYRALEARCGGFPDWQTVDELAALCAPLRPFTLAAATDGNHGRAVAHMARLLGFAARIFVPAGTTQARIEAIMGEGAAVTIVDGTYDQAVIRSAQEAGPRCLVVSDTSWPGYEDIPRQVITGYATIFTEVDDELARRDELGPNLVVVQIGVGALMAAAVSHYRQSDERPVTSNNSGEFVSAELTVAKAPAILGVEPIQAACVLASLKAGRIVEVPGPHDSIMAGLNCGLPSLIAWPIISSGIDAVVAIDDQRACQSVRDLAAMGITAGETGAAGFGGLAEALFGPNAAALREHLGINHTTRVLLISTEGETDPVVRSRILTANCARDCTVREACKVN
ncbi:MAG: diaminopropionate ammonia-lyase [Roseiflexaceae bacterium]|nr:diaminopropionate ammonia-lyase [Roseiflexaceae bacterium]